MQIKEYQVPRQSQLVTITYPTRYGYSHTIQYIEDLNDPNSADNWQKLPGAPHNGGVVFDTNIVSQRFYRLLVNEQ